MLLVWLLFCRARAGSHVNLHQHKSDMHHYRGLHIQAQPVEVEPSTAHRPDDVLQHELRGCSPDAHEPKPADKQLLSILPKQMAATAGAVRPTILDQQRTCALTDHS